MGRAIAWMWHTVACMWKSLVQFLASLGRDGGVKRTLSKQGWPEGIEASVVLLGPMLCVPCTGVVDGSPTACLNQHLASWEGGMVNGASTLVGPPAFP